MRTLYIDCGMGAAGDMLTAALLELLPEEERVAFVAEFNSIGIPGVEMRVEPSVKCGITGTHVTILVNGEEEGEEMHLHHHHDHGHGHHHDDHGHDHHHHDDHGHDHHHHDHHEHDHHHHHDHMHHGMHDIEHIVRDHLDLPENVREDVLTVYGYIAAAESHAHGVPVSEIHFHEVGTMDAVADVTAVCLLMDRIGAERIVVSPINTGSGTVRCAHGILPVPAPATAFILQGLPIYSNEIQSELCTPTGAALLRHFATEFGSMPALRAERIGYGMGKKDFEAANCVRMILGESCDAAGADACGTGDSTPASVLELSCNIDDMTAEELGFALERMMEEGALDAWAEPIMMKKSRPGTKFSVLCRPEEQERFCRLMFLHTTTIGIRMRACERAVLTRSEAIEETPYGAVRKKVVSGYGVTREKYEYDDLAEIARAKGISLREVKR